VATDTLTCGTSGVAVKIGVGDRVAVGVRVGTSGVDVATGEFTTSTGIIAPAVCVTPEIIVCMMAVPREFISWVGAGAGITQARETINKTLTDKRMGVDFFILPPFGNKAIIILKMRNHPPT
jgi:hypothetical protein